MSLTFYSGAGSPYAWRVWLALEHKQAKYEHRVLSFDSGDLKAEWFRALNPRGRVPVLVDDGFSLYESAAIVDYIEERIDGPSLYPNEHQARALARRMLREADQYIAIAMEKLVEHVLYTEPTRWLFAEIEIAKGELVSELALWEAYLSGEYLAGEISAVDYTVFPMVALARRILRKADVGADILGPKLAAWADRVEALTVVQKTWPAHWR